MNDTTPTDHTSATPADDRIEDEIYIAADLDTVWQLVARPGWWINDGDVDPEPVLREQDDHVVLTHPEWGDFALQVVELDEPRYAAFRWRSAPASELGDAATLVELWVEQTIGGVTLKVAESGFTTLSEDPQAAAQQRSDNAEGWANELKAARTFATRSRG
ncbi:MAG: ATPase [Nocardioides sp.]|nr:ATPase [Nocardioides sp.]